MQKLTRADLWSLEDYAQRRAAFRAEVMAHKKNRRLILGNHLSLHFEDRTTIRYQVQEMLRIERLFERAEIEAELDAYNPLIPDGCNWKVTMMIEYDDPHARARALEELLGVEDKVWVRVDGFERVWPIADEDLERATAEKTSSVHFLRFELTPGMVAAVKAGTAVGIGVDHPACREAADPLPAPVRDALAADLA